MKKHAFKNNCHAEPSSAFQRFFGCKFLSFRGRSPWNLKNLHPLNDGKSYLSSGREKNFNTSLASVRNLREGKNNNCHSEGFSPKNRKVCECNRKSWRFFASHSSALNDVKRTAFTLAEVLITLTIIGVIAALTIPNLMQKYKKHQVEVQLKAAYSIVYNALNMAKTDKGLNWTEMLDDAATHTRYATRINYFGETYIAPYLKHTKTCNYGNNNNCSDIFSYGSFTDYNGNSMGGSGILGGPYFFYKMKLQNGMSLGVAADIGDVPGNRNLAYFLIDINGNKGPNQVGKDIFFFILLASNFWCDEKTAPKWCTPNESLWAGSGVAPKARTSMSYCIDGAAACALMIQRNGWKIPDDYPVKKW